MRGLLSMFAIGLLAASLWQAARAQSASGAEWACWYAGGHQVHCVLLRAAVAQQVSMLPQTQPSTGRQVPAAVRTIQDAGTQLYGELVRIPLLSEPDDPALVQQLAHSTVCGLAASCRMTYTVNPPDIAMLTQSQPGVR